VFSGGFSGGWVLGVRCNGFIELRLMRNKFSNEKSGERLAEASNR
jgi:hypothetical protein